MGRRGVGVLTLMCIDNVLWGWREVTLNVSIFVDWRIFIRRTHDMCLGARVQKSKHQSNHAFDWRVEDGHQLRRSNIERTIGPYTVYCWMLAPLMPMTKLLGSTILAFGRDMALTPSPSPQLLSHRKNEAL